MLSRRRHIRIQTIMIKRIKIPEKISTRTEYKRKFTPGEMYRAFVLLPGAIGRMIYNGRKKLVSREFIERIQLAVTEVNGCAACSYAHTYMAIKQGMSNEEIHSFLSGDGGFIKPEEARAIVFAQHYADNRGSPEKDAYESLISEYGEKRARVILAAARLMHAGNIYGIPYSAFISRLRGRPYRESTLVYELGMQLSGIVLLPVALVHGLLKTMSSGRR